MGYKLPLKSAINTLRATGMTRNDVFLLGSVTSQSDGRIISMLFCVFVNYRSKLMMSQVDDNEMDTRFEVGSTVFA